MRHRLRIASIACVIAFAAAASAKATTLTWTAPLSVNDFGIVGVADGAASDRPGEDAFLIAQHILDMLKSSTQFYDGRRVQTSSTEYTGSLLGSGAKTDCRSCSIAAGWDYAIAKYDGHNGGWILFHLGGNAAVLPQYSYGIWGNNAQQYQISDFTVFNVAPVPDSGPTALLLAASLAALGLLRRQFA